MGRKSFVLRGLPSFAILAEHLVKDESFAADVTEVLKLRESVFNTLARTLKDTGPFLDRTSVSTVVDGVIEDEDLSGTISHFISRLNDLLRDAEDPFENALATLQDAIVSQFPNIGEDDRAELSDRIEQLVSLPEGFARQHKAEQLIEATGVELGDFQIICDMRPVFDEERSRIEGVIPVSTLIVDTISADGGISSVQVRLSEQQVLDILRKAEYASGKIAAIKRTLREKSIVIPKTSATIDEEVAG